MSFTSPLGLVALAAIPAVLVLHLYRRKFRERRVGGLFLFAPDVLRAAAGRTRSRLLRSASLWCELLLALLAALWLGGLEFGVSNEQRHIVFVLDDSASMAGTFDGRTSAARARDRVLEIVADLPGDSLATVVLTGARPEVLLGPRAPLPLVERALDDWRPWRPSHDLASGLDLAFDLAGEAGELHLMTDRMRGAESLPSRCQLHAVGAPADNVAILSARREETEDGREQLFVDLCSFARASASTHLSVFATGGGEVRVLAEQDLTLEPGQLRHISISLALTDLTLVVQVGDDALSPDNVFTLLPRPSRIVRVAVAWPTEIESALFVDDVLSALSSVERVHEAATAHLLLGDDSTNSRHQIRVASVDPAAPDERDTWLGPYLIERRDPLCDGLTLDGVVWTSPRIETDAFPLVSAGSRALLTRDDSSAGRLSLTLHLDPLRSNFAGSPDWPILLTNVCEAVRKMLPGAEDTNVLVGGVIRWRRHTSDAKATLDLVDPLGQRRPGRGLGLVTWHARHPGEHLLERDGQPIGRFSVNFADAGESDLRDRNSGELAATQPPPGARSDAGTLDAADHAGRGKFEARMLAWLLLLVAAIDWLVLGGRSSVVGAVGHRLREEA